MTVLLWCFWGIWRYLRFSLISSVDFYYVINKLIILIVLIQHLKYLSIGISLLLTIRYG
jgi:hypothetical protein